MLAPLALPGYVLSYDMVFVPHQPLTWELIAPSGGLPRAVPLDAVISLLSVAVPGWLIQRIALVGLVYAAALGAARLVPADRILTRLVAMAGYAWTPLLAERLLLGQWALLLAYAALPWLIMASSRVRRDEPGGFPRLILAAAVASLTPTGSVIALMATIAFTSGRSPPVLRRAGIAVGAVIALMLPWVVAALTASASGRSDAAGVAAFSARAENWSGTLGALAGTGGAWNALTMPRSRASVLIPVVTLAVLALAAYGYARLRQRWPDGDAVRLAWFAGIGFLLAALGSLPPTASLLGWIVTEIPGGGLLRDGQKFLMPYALALACCAALGTERVAERLAPERGRLVLATMVALPIAALPDLAFGGTGALRPVHYPADWDRVAAIVSAEPGTLLALPFSEYQSFSWNRGRTVIDPAPRYLRAEVLPDDLLYVGDQRIEGENPDAARVRALLAEGKPLSLAGMRWILVEHDGRMIVPATQLAGLERRYSGPNLDLYANPTPASSEAPATGRRLLLVVVNLAALALVVAAGWRLRRSATPW
jgi:hypothetical protein